MHLEILVVMENVSHSSEAIPFDVCIAKGARWRVEDDGNWRLP